MQEVKELLSVMDLEQIETNIFRGPSHDVGAHHVFGGQVLSQALHAAILTVAPDRHPHSMHAYFILPGDQTKPIVYIVEQVRDGGSFSTRRVRAVQNGHDIFVTAISFQLEQEGLNHQIEVPDVTPPEKLSSDQDLLKKYADQLPPGFKRFLLPRPIEFRPVDPLNFILPERQEPVRYVWIRAKGKVPGDQAIQKRLLAYASDYNLLTTAIQPHQHEVSYFHLQLASIDHAMWFHRPFDLANWHLYAVDSPSASNSRGFTRGSIFDQNGLLVASVVQEGLMRKKRR